MNKIVALILSIFSVLLVTKLSAQAPQNVYFTGLGRALVTNDKLSDNINEASKQKASGGYTLFDLGIYARASEVLRGGVILRVRNEFGGFYGDGGSLQFRQMQLEGLIAKKVKYDIGDIYLSQTKYTLWNEDNMSHKYESELFSLRRGIVNYENFFVGNNWRMQGVNASGKVNFGKGVESLGIRGYGGRTRQTNYTNIPDRYFYGGKLDLTQSKYLRIAGNLAGISDIPGTVKTTSVNYSNTVYTTDFDLTYDESEKFKFVIKGEIGGSHFSLNRVSDNQTRKFEDYFYDGGAKATYKPLNLTLGASYRNVGYNFNSPMAQTRRVLAPGDVRLQTFPTLNNDINGSITPRQISLFDFYSQEQGLYNQSISTTLMDYYIQYNIVEPYGKATPNRKGFTFTGEIEDANKIFTVSGEANLLSEIASEGDANNFKKRKFILLQGGAVLNINKLIGFEKKIALTGGYRHESSKREIPNRVDLKNSLVDVGLDVEVLKDLHLLGGVKLFRVKGNEVKSTRDALNQIGSFTAVTFNQSQNIIAAGLRYDYGTNGYFSMQYNTVRFDDKNAPVFNKDGDVVSPNTTYNLNQLFFVFGLKF